jgi:hypothetical protein
MHVLSVSLTRLALQSLQIQYELKYWKSFYRRRRGKLKTEVKLRTKTYCVLVLKYSLCIVKPTLIRKRLVTFLKGKIQCYTHCFFYLYSIRCDLEIRTVA